MYSLEYPRAGRLPPSPLLENSILMFDTTMNTYYLTTKFKILSTIVPLLVFLLFFITARSNVVCFGIISACIIFFTVKSIISEHIALSSSGIEYHRLGLTFHAKWENTREINIHWFAPFEQEGIFINSDLIQITEWWQGSYKAYGGWSQRAFIPLSKFSDNWRDSELGRQIKQYAPHLLEQEETIRANS